MIPVIQRFFVERRLSRLLADLAKVHNGFSDMFPGPALKHLGGTIIFSKKPLASHLSKWVEKIREQIVALTPLCPRFGEILGPLWSLAADLIETIEQGGFNGPEHADKIGSTLFVISGWSMSWILTEARGQGIGISFEDRVSSMHDITKMAGLSVKVSSDGEELLRVLLIELQMK